MLTVEIIFFINISIRTNDDELFIVRSLYILCTFFFESAFNGIIFVVAVFCWDEINLVKCRVENKVLALYSFARKIYWKMEFRFVTKVFCFDKIAASNESRSVISWLKILKIKNVCKWISNFFLFFFYIGKLCDVNRAESNQPSVRGVVQIYKMYRL